MIDRIKNPLFLAAAVSFLYNVTNYICNQILHITIDPSEWLTFFNLLLWIVLGIGVYANYTPSQTYPTPQPIQYNPPFDSAKAVQISEPENIEKTSQTS